MKCAPKGPLADSIERYLAHKRSLGKHLTKVGSMLHLLDGHLLARGVPNERQIRRPTSKDSSPRGHGDLPAATTASLAQFEDSWIGWWSMRSCRSRPCTAKVGASLRRRGRSSLVPMRHAGCSSWLANCPVIPERRIAERSTG